MLLADAKVIVGRKCLDGQQCSPIGNP